MNSRNYKVHDPAISKLSYKPNNCKHLVFNTFWDHFDDFTNCDVKENSEAYTSRKCWQLCRKYNMQKIWQLAFVSKWLFRL